MSEGWSWCRLENIGNWGAGATPKRSNLNYYNGNIPWLKTGDLNDGLVTEIPEHISEEALNKTSVRINPIGSVLIAMYGATIGKVGILGIPATTNQACCTCICASDMNNYYLYYYLMYKKTDFIKAGVGGAQPNISKEKINRTLMPLPPVAEQNKIVTKIDCLLKYLDELEDTLI